MKPEKLLVDRLTSYIQSTYGDTIYRIDLAADMKLTLGQAARNKRLHPVRGYPDLFIAEARGGFFGLYLELKADGTTIRLKNGELTANPHIQEQARMLARLRQQGYRAEFGIGLDSCIEIIDRYMAAAKTYPGHTYAGMRVKDMAKAKIYVAPPPISASSNSELESIDELMP